MKKWTIEDSKELYNINGWGTSYFGMRRAMSLSHLVRITRK